MSHSEHKELLDALGNNLKEEVARGLKLLDTCASQIGKYFEEFIFGI